MVDKCMVANSVTKRMVMSASRIKNMYVVDIDSIEGDDLSCMRAQVDDADIWHQRLGHVNSSLLKNLLQGTWSMNCLN